MIESIGTIIGLFGIWLCFCDISYKAIPYCLITGMVLLCVGSALAHDHSRPELNSWFDKLASQKGPCCSMADGLSLADVDWESRNGRYWVNLEKQWVEVEDSALIKQPNLAGRAWVWPFKGTDGQIIVRCFIPGSMI